MDRFPVRRTTIVSLIAVLLFVASCGGDGDSAGPTTPGSSTPETRIGMLTSARPEVGEPAPDFALIDARDGTVRKLSDYQGKAIVLNFFASWCDPCEREIPAFVAAENANKDDLLVVAVNWQEDEEAALGTLNELDAGFPALLDEDGDVGRHYRVTGLPVTYFLDENLVVRSFRIGEVTDELLSENLAKVGITYSGPED